MALLDIHLFTKLEKTRNSVHKPVEATYTVFQEKEKTSFQIDTYGTPGRAMPGKVSQSIQVDEVMARHLLDLLKKEFRLA